MARRAVWICDRCGTEADEPKLTKPWLVGLGEAPQGWLSFSACGGVIFDVCPACVTASERADDALARAERAADEPPAAVVIDLEAARGLSPGRAGAPPVEAA